MTARGMVLKATLFRVRLWRILWTVPSYQCGIINAIVGGIITGLLFYYILAYCIVGPSILKLFFLPSRRLYRLY